MSDFEDLQKHLKAITDEFEADETLTLALMRLAKSLHLLEEIKEKRKNTEQYHHVARNVRAGFSDFERGKWISCWSLVTGGGESASSDR